MDYELTEQEREILEKSRIAQGLPLKVTDPATLRLVASIMIASKQEAGTKDDTHTR